MSQNRWTEEEIALVLELYLIKGGSSWYSKINDKTPEIITLSYILKNWDTAPADKNLKYRSTGAVRLKMANLESLDERFSKKPLANGSNLDKQVWNKYFNDLDNLMNFCRESFAKHYKGNITDNVQKYRKEILNSVSDFSDSMFTEYCSKQYSTISELRERAIATDNLEKYRNIIKDCDTLLGIYEKYKVGNLEEDKSKSKLKVHGGINQIPLSTEDKRFSEKLKIGALVQQTFLNLVTENKLSDLMVKNLCSEEYCHQTFHLGHSFLKKIDNNYDRNEQKKDENGYVRYYKNSLWIKGAEYYLCKEWYESGRKYYLAWLQSVNEPVKLSEEDDQYKNLINYLIAADNDSVFIKIDKVIKTFPGIDALDLILDDLVNRKILKYYNNDSTKIVVEDYDKLYQLRDHPEQIKGNHHARH